MHYPYDQYSNHLTHQKIHRLKVPPSVPVCLPNLDRNARTFPRGFGGAGRSPSSESSDEDDSSLDDEAGVPAGFLPASLGSEEESAIEVLDFEPEDDWSFSSGSLTGSGFEALNGDCG